MTKCAPHRFFSILFGRFGGGLEEGSEMSFQEILRHGGGRLRICVGRFRHVLGPSSPRQALPQLAVGVADCKRTDSHKTNKTTTINHQSRDELEKKTEEKGSGVSSFTERSRLGRTSLTP